MLWVSESFIGHDFSYVTFVVAVNALHLPRALLDLLFIHFINYKNTKLKSLLRQIHDIEFRNQLYLAGPQAFAVLFLTANELLVAQFLCTCKSNAKHVVPCFALVAADPLNLLFGTRALRPRLVALFTNLILVVN